MKTDNTTIKILLSVISECEWALTDAINKDKINYLQEEARDKARETLEEYADLIEE